MLDDPTLYVLNKMEEVLKELRVTVERINIYEHKNEIATLPQTMKDADGIILATTVEWLGIGGYMQQFLDACWLYVYSFSMRSFTRASIRAASIRLRLFPSLIPLQRQVD